MTQKIYVGNLSYSTTDDSLASFFSEFGSVTEAKVIVDRFTGRSKGFGFVTFDSADDAKAALQANGKEFDGRQLKVNEAREQQRRDGGGGRGGQGGRGGYRN